MRKDRRRHRLPQRDGMRLQMHDHIQASILSAQRFGQDVSEKLRPHSFIHRERDRCSLLH